MRKSKYALVGAAVALVVLAAMVGPASASAAVWLHNGQPLTERTELTPRGGEVIQVPRGTFLCNSEATIATEGGSTAEITAYAVELSSCEGYLGEFKGCEVTTATPRNLPWAVTVNSEDLTAKEVGVSYTFDEACPIHKVETSFPELTLTLEEPSAIRYFEFGQEGSGKVDGETGWLIDSGVLQLPEGEWGAYGIG